MFWKGYGMRKLKVWMGDMGITAQTLADNVDVSRVTVTNLMNGKSTADGGRAVDIAEFLKWPNDPMELFEEVDLLGKAEQQEPEIKHIDVPQCSVDLKGEGFDVAFDPKDGKLPDEVFVSYSSENEWVANRYVNAVTLGRSTECPVAMVPDLPDGVKSIKCMVCGYETVYSVGGEPLHKDCDGGFAKPVYCQHCGGRFAHDVVADGE